MQKSSNFTYYKFITKEILIFKDILKDIGSYCIYIYI